MEGEEKKEKKWRTDATRRERHIKKEVRVSPAN